MVEHQRKVADIVRKDPAVDYVNSTVGGGGPNSLPQQRPHAGRAEAAQRARQAAPVILARLRQDANIVPGIEIFFQPIQNINLGGKLSKSQYQYTLQSNDTETLYRVAPELRDKIAKISGLLDVTTDLYVKNPQVDGRGRSREVGGLRRHRRSGAPGALQRLRLAPGRDHLHAGQRLSGDPREPSREISRAAPKDLNDVYLKTHERHRGAAVGGHANSCARSARCRSTTRASSRR